MENKTIVLCDITSCLYNSSCCSCPDVSMESHCNKNKIKMRIDEFGSFECSEYVDDYNKEVECPSCQILKYNGIRLVDEKEFTIEE